jgi:hypothetical protein
MPALSLLVDSSNRHWQQYPMLWPTQTAVLRWCHPERSTPTSQALTLPSARAHALRRRRSTRSILSWQSWERSHSRKRCQRPRRPASVMAPRSMRCRWIALRSRCFPYSPSRASEYRPLHCCPSHQRCASTLPRALTSVGAFEHECTRVQHSPLLQPRADAQVECTPRRAARTVLPTVLEDKQATARPFAHAAIHPSALSTTHARTRPFKLARTHARTHLRTYERAHPPIDAHNALAPACTHASGFHGRPCAGLAQSDAHCRPPHLATRHRTRAPNGTRHACNGRSRMPLGLASSFVEPDFLR